MVNWHNHFVAVVIITRQRDHHRAELLNSWYVWEMGGVGRENSGWYTNALVIKSHGVWVNSMRKYMLCWERSVESKERQAVMNGSVWNFLLYIFYKLWTVVPNLQLKNNVSCIEYVHPLFLSSSINKLWFFSLIRVMWPFLGRLFISAKRMTIQRKKSTKVQLGKPLNLLGLLTPQRSMNDSKTVTYPEVGWANYCQICYQRVPNSA